MEENKVWFIFESQTSELDRIEEGIQFHKSCTIQSGRQGLCHSKCALCGQKWISQSLKEEIARHPVGRRIGFVPFQTKLKRKSCIRNLKRHEKWQRQGEQVRKMPREYKNWFNSLWGRNGVRGKHNGTERAHRNKLAHIYLPVGRI